MHRKGRWIRGSLASSLLLLLPLLGSSEAEAATRGMIGSLGVQNPSVAPPFLWDGGPAVLGKKQGVYPPTAGFATVQVTGATGSTSVGRQVTLAANKMNFSGGRFRDFTAFPNVAQTVKTFMSVQQAATFMVGGGALGACPGDGCFGSGTGTAISWCPPNAHNPASPAPGTVGAQIGNWNCTSYGAPGSGNRRGVIRISNAPGAPHFGGTLSLLRNSASNVWRVAVQPSTPMANDAQVERSWMDLQNLGWTPGRPNFQYTGLPGNNGPRIFGRLNNRGAVEATFGCANGLGTVGVPFNGIPPANGPFSPIVGPGSNCGTNPVNRPDGQGWGFAMTTGTISGSDDFPFSDETTALGTPFNPNRVILTAMQGFFFTRMGDDSVTGTGANGVRNLVLLGGSITVDPASGNVFNRVSRVQMRLQVPEPASLLGLVAGVGALAALARRRR